MACSCVGRPVTGTEVRIIAIRDDQLSADPGEARALPAGRIGEVLVAGESVSQRYYANAVANAFHKVWLAGSEPGIWHRTGDLGYIDQSGRLWLCGRMTQRVRTASGDLYPLPSEAVFDAHHLVRRSALVGIDRGDDGDGYYQTPVVCIEPNAPLRSRQWGRLVAELRCRGAPRAVRISALGDWTLRYRCFDPKCALHLPGCRFVRDSLVPAPARRRKHRPRPG